MLNALTGYFLHLSVFCILSFSNFCFIASNFCFMASNLLVLFYVRFVVCVVMNKQKIAVFGSAFNPPHRGHEDVIAQALVVFDHVLVIPNYKHAFGKVMMPFELRLAMAQSLAVESPTPSRVTVLDVECDIAQRKTAAGDSTPIYTYDVLCELEARYPQAQLHFVIGPDNADPIIWRQFYKADEITRRWQLWFAKERIAVRSTLIREGLVNGMLPSLEQCNAKVIDLLRAFYIG